VALGRFKGCALVRALIYEKDGASSSKWSFQLPTAGVLGSQGALVRSALRAKPVDATPSNQLIRQYFPWRTDLSGCNQSTLARAVFSLNQRSRTTLALSRLLQVDFELVLRRPIETAALIRHL
jgi:hypothetical protein